MIRRLLPIKHPRCKCWHYGYQHYKGKCEARVYLGEGQYMECFCNNLIIHIEGGR